MITEADTCRKYVVPKLYSSGWNDDQISEQKTFTDGRIVVTGEKYIRKKQKRSDFLLKYRRDFSIAVVEAKSAYKDAGDGLQQKELLEELNLHTIVRLPNGVFAPYTGIPTNLLFFERGGPTKEIWYFEIPLPEGRKQYNKTQPMQFEEFAPVIEWWKDRKENGHAWKVPAAKVIESGYNLDIKNPNGKADLEHLPPEQLTESILKKEKRIAEIMSEIKGILSKGVQE